MAATPNKLLIETPESAWWNALYRMDKMFQSAIRIAAKSFGVRYKPFSTCDDSINLDITTSALTAAQESGTSHPGLSFSSGFSFSGNDYRFGGWSGFELDGKGNIIGVSDEGFAFKAKPTLNSLGDIVGFEEPLFGSLKDINGVSLSGKMFTDAEDITVLLNGQLAVSFERDHRVLVYDDILEPAVGSIKLPQEMCDALSVFDEAYKATGNRQYANVGIESLTVVNGKMLAVIEETLPQESEHRVYMQNSMCGWDEMYYSGGADYGVSSATTLPNGNVLFLERATEYFSGYEHYDCRIVEICKDDLFLGNHFIGKELVHFDKATADNFESIFTYKNAAGDVMVGITSDDNYAWSQRNLFMNFKYDSDGNSQPELIPNPFLDGVQDMAQLPEAPAF